MFRRTKIAFLVAMILGAAPAALAGNEHHGSPTGAKAARQAHQNPLPWRNSLDGGRGAFGYQPTEPTARPLTPFERNWFDYQKDNG